MFTPFDGHLNDLRLQDIQRNAARAGLVLESGHSHHPIFVLRLYRPAFSRIGFGLVWVGTHLQRRYGEIHAAPFAQHRPMRSGGGKSGA